MAPMFPNLKSMDLRVKGETESLLFPLQEDFFSFSLRLLNNSNVSYRKKRGTLWPVSRRVKSAEILIVFPNLVWVL
jgi:hypothetical protein